MRNVAFGKGEGRGGRYFRGSRKFGIASDKKLAQSVVTHGPLFRHGPNIFCAASHTVGYNKLCGIYLVFQIW